jgi:aminoglycoside 3-N-acetyltransferase
MYSREERANDFRELGIAAGDTVMLHASVRAVGEVATDPDAIHLALKSALTPEGALMMYASCPRFYDEWAAGTSPWSKSGNSMRSYRRSILS